jgi:hypothetical protein
VRRRRTEGTSRERRGGEGSNRRERREVREEAEVRSSRASIGWEEVRGALIVSEIGSPDLNQCRLELLGLSVRENHGFQLQLRPKAGAPITFDDRFSSELHLHSSSGDAPPPTGLCEATQSPTTRSPRPQTGRHRSPLGQTQTLTTRTQYPFYRRIIKSPSPIQIHFRLTRLPRSHTRSRSQYPTPSPDPS